MKKDEVVTYKTMDVYAPSFNLKKIRKDPKVQKMIERSKQAEKDEQSREPNKKS